MISTEALEEMARDIRYEKHHQKGIKGELLLSYYEIKLELLDELIDISKGVDNERKFERGYVCESGQNQQES